MRAVEKAMGGGHLSHPQSSALLCAVSIKSNKLVRTVDNKCDCPPVNTNSRIYDNRRG